MTISDYIAPRLYIGGEWLGAEGRDSRALINPATGAEIARMPVANATDLDRALAAAEDGFALWRARSPVERGRVLKGAAALIRARGESIARLITLEIGKPLAESRLEVLMAAGALEWFGEEGRRAYGRTLPGRVGTSRFMVVKEPVGPVAAFAAWNFPLDAAARKIGAALAAGCSIIHKPAEEAPSPALALLQALVDSALPPGVASVVFGVPDDISRHLLASPVIRKISFTGSVAIGKHLLKLAADGMKRTTMELGGHAPALVFDDADLEPALDILVSRKFRNAGQVCVSPTRFLVQDDVFEKFRDGFTQRAKALPVGDGLVETNVMGPLAHERRLEATHALVTDAVDKGAKLLTGGRRIGNQGYFYAPTVLADVPLSARVMHEEPFGPIAVINRHTGFEDMVAEANRLPFGLAAYAFTGSGRTMLDVSDALEAGMVAINSCNIATAETPFGGVKDSGHGAENGIEGVEACLVTKTVSLA
jgi:succinate-semialdehyde dehydrogenase/glutarate-semialdehyde dehydrogenase